MMESGEALEFPNYVEASVTLPGDIAVKPVFSLAQNYAIAAVGDSLYHMELRHGRVHGKTGLPGTITGLARGNSGSIFAVAGDHLCRIEGFDLAADIQLSQQCTALSICGDNPILLMEDGTLILHNSGDLSPQAQGTSELSDIRFIQGFNGMVCIASSKGNMETLSVPEFAKTAESTVGGNVMFLERAGKGTILFSCDSWNEAACCSIDDLVIDKMFTFPVAPTDAAADSSVAYIYCAVPGSGVQVCRESGEIAWKSSAYEDGSMVVLSDDCETAVIASGNRLDILIL